MKRIISYICLSAVMLLLMNCSSKQREGKENGKPTISVTVIPEIYFVENIAGDKVNINCVVPEGQSPESYEPTSQEMVSISKSRAYFSIGSIGFEQAWMERIASLHPDLKICNLSDGMSLIASPEPMGESDEHEHHHGANDPHIWCSVAGARVMAQNVMQAMIQMDPENTDYYRSNEQRLLERIDSTGVVVDSILKNVKSRTFIIYHPALTYFAAENHLQQLCIEMDGKEPTPAQLALLVKQSKESGVRVVFVQMEFDSKNAEIISKETGCRLVRINPLARDWSRSMIDIAKTLADGETD